MKKQRSIFQSAPLAQVGILRATSPNQCGVLILSAMLAFCAVYCLTQRAAEAVEVGTTDAKAAQFAQQGAALLQRGDLHAAAEAFKRSVALSGDPSAAHTYIGSVYERFGRSLEAIHEFQAARQLRSRSPQTTFNLALAYFRAGFYDRAISILRQAPDQLHNSEEFCRLLGDAYVQSANFPEGVRYLRTAVALAPSAPDDAY
ncbi:MAG: tetratricopeptide repeat protein, partial [Terriglobia bacterium]